jgi:hypothetical protein
MKNEKEKRRKKRTKCGRGISKQTIHTFFAIPAWFHFSKAIPMPLRHTVLVRCAIQIECTNGNIIVRIT